MRGGFRDNLIRRSPSRRKHRSARTGGFTFRLSAGPLISRNAGPLGPILASTGRDPTPEVDRYERALYQDIERRGFDAGSGEGYESSGGEISDEGGPVLAMPGPGGFPLKVTALASRRRSDLSSLVSAIATPVDCAMAMHSIDAAQIAATDDSSSRAESPSYARFIRRLACGPELGDVFGDVIPRPARLAKATPARFARSPEE